MYLKYYEEKASKIGNNFVFESALSLSGFIRFSCSFRTLYFALFTKYIIIAKKCELSKTQTEINEYLIFVPTVPFCPCRFHIPDEEKDRERSVFHSRSAQNIFQI